MVEAINTNIRVSVVVPVYNSEDTIGACIESILCQSFSDIECIIVDDGSKDKSGSICDEYAVKDNRLIVIHQPNKGRTEARAVGVSKSKGDWISFVDSDDTLPIDAIALMMDKANDNVDIVLGNGYSLSPETRQLILMDDFRHLAVRGEGTIGLPWGSLYRRQIMTPYLFDIPRHIMMGEDYIFWLRLVFSTEKPVSIVYESVYNKGDEHTCNTFHWTVDYCYELNELRKSAIPVEKYDEYISETIEDRLVNMFAIAVCCPKSEWKGSRYYQDILADMKHLGLSMPLKRRLFFSLPSISLRKLYSYLSNRRG